MVSETHVARFDHVNTKGQLVFTCDGRDFSVNVDDELERAILEAKQILSEHMEETAPVQRTQPLPISQIQSLIRAGATAEQVASKYNLSEAIVRRFSASVEAEKQYAINQFLHVGAPRESHMHIISELIENTLAAAQVPARSVKWTATRRGLEPWQIAAAFDSNGRQVVARWSWNMRDNAVVCENNAASVLLGEFIPSEDTAIKAAAAAKADSANYPTSLNLPGNSADSARIEMTLSSWRQDQAAAVVAERDALRMEASGKGKETVSSPTQQSAVSVSSDTQQPSHDMSSTPDSADHSTDPSSAEQHNATEPSDEHSEPLATSNAEQANSSASSSEHSNTASSPAITAAPRSEEDDAREAARKRTPNVSISAIASGRPKRHNTSSSATSSTSSQSAARVTSSHATQAVQPTPQVDEDFIPTPAGGFPAVDSTAPKKPKKNNAFRSWEDIIFGQ